MRQLKQSTSTYNLGFLMVDSADHVTGKTGLAPAVWLSKNSGAFLRPSGTVTEVAFGWYQLAGNVVDTDTLGSLALHASGTGADPTDVEFIVVAYDPFNSTSLGLSRVDENISSPKTLIDGTQVFVTGTVAQVTNVTTVATTTNLTNGVTVNTNNDKTGYFLDATYDAAKTAATQTSVNLLAAAVAALNNITAADVWSYTTRTLTSYGTLVSDIWNYVTRTLTSGGGITAADVWTYVTRTLTSGGGGGGATAQEVWEYGTRTLTQTAPQIIQSLTDNTQVNVYKSTTFDTTFTQLPDFTGWQKLWFTVKEDVRFEVPDTESIIQIQISNPSGTADGLLYINRDAAVNASDGYITVLSPTSIQVKVNASVTGNLPPKTLYYGIKYLNSAGDTIALTDGGEFVIRHSTSKKVS